MLTPRDVSGYCFKRVVGVEHTCERSDGSVAPDSGGQRLHARTREGLRPNLAGSWCACLKCGVLSVDVVSTMGTYAQRGEHPACLSPFLPPHARHLFVPMTKFFL